MAAHMIGPAGTTPPTQREAELQAEIERLREVIGQQGILLSATRQVIEATREVGHGPMAMHWSPSCTQCQAIAAYDKVAEEARP